MDGNHFYNANADFVAGCLPEVEPSERSKLSAPAVMIRNVPQQQQQQYSTYDDMRSACKYYGLFVRLPIAAYQR